MCARTCGAGVDERARQVVGVSGGQFVGGSSDVGDVVHRVRSKWGRESPRCLKHDCRATGDWCGRVSGQRNHRRGGVRNSDCCRGG